MGIMATVFEVAYTVINMKERTNNSIQGKIYEIVALVFALSMYVLCLDLLNRYKPQEVGKQIQLHGNTCLNVWNANNNRFLNIRVSLLS